MITENSNYNERKYTIMKKIIMALLAAAAINATATVHITWMGTENEVIDVILFEHNIWHDGTSLAIYYTRVQFFFVCDPPLNANNSDFETHVEATLKDGTFDGSLGHIYGNAWDWAFTAVSFPQSNWAFEFDTPEPLNALFVLAVFEATELAREEWGFDGQYFWTWTMMLSDESKYDGPEPPDTYAVFKENGFHGGSGYGDLPFYDIPVIPEPATGLLALAGIALLAARKRKRK